MKISVIVPVYNAVNFLEQSISSILSQTLEAFELILVNDGSIDGSGDLCDKFAGKDNRIIVIHKANGGASSARNAGLEVARGDYITFVDCDDYVEKDYLERLYCAVSGTDADLAVSGCFWEQNGEFENMSNPNANYTRKEYIDAVCSEKIAYITAYGSCCKLYKRTLLFENSIRFDSRYRLSEDRIFNIDIMEMMQSAVSVSYTGYHYVDNPVSLTHTRHKRSILKNIIEADCTVWNRFEQMTYSLGIYDEYGQYIKDNRLHALLAMDKYIVNSEDDGSRIKKNELYKAAISLVNDAVLTPSRNSIVWRTLNYAVSQGNIPLLRTWTWLMRIKQRIKN